MPVPTDTLYNIRRLNVWFAISAAFLALCTFWMIWDDYDRPWKGHQDRYMAAQAALAELQYRITQQKSFQQKLEQARANVHETKKDVDRDQNADYAGWLDDLAENQASAYSLDLQFKQKDAWVVVTRSDYEKTVALEGADSELAKRIAEKLKQDEQDLADTRRRKEEVEDEIRVIRRKLKEVEKDYRAAQRQLGDLQKLVDQARSKREQFGSKLGKAIFNIPLGDFAAPKGTPARYEIKQVVAQDVKSKLNFLEGYRVDRCTTCHVVIDDVNFTHKNLVAQFEQAIPAIAEALAKSNPAAGAVSVAMPEPPKVYGLSDQQLRGQVAVHWDRVSKQDGDAYFDELQNQVNAYLVHVGMPTIDLGHPLQAHPDLDLFLTSDSPHPLNKMGCTVCHEGNGSETDFVLAAHTPKSHREEEEWTHKYYDRNLGVPTMTWRTLEHFWDFPMIPPQYSEASCAKCHQALDDIARFENENYGEKIKKGKKLYTQLGCINCHRVENIEGMRRVGTDLTHVASKLTDGFMHNWIFSPRDFRPATWMPHFYMQENNGPDSANVWDPDPLLRTRTEVQAITYYLRTVSKPWSPKAVPSAVVGDAAIGHQLFASVGCLACHANMAEYGEAWIVNDLFERMISEDADADEDEVFEKAEAQFARMDLNAQTKYAVENFTEQPRKIAKQRAQREELLAASQRRDPDPRRMYVPPLFTRFAPDLSAMGSKVTKQWLYSWLLEPRHYSSYTKMPRLRLTEQEALDLAEYLSTFKHDSFEMTPFASTDETMTELDRRMDDLLSGQNSQATVEKINADENGLLTARLIAQISKHPDPSVQKRLKEHYRQVVSAKDLTQRKMLFVGQKLITHYGCYACHKIEGFEGTPQPGTELTDWGEKNIHQLDFAFFSGAYHHTLAQTEEFQVLYPKDRADLIGWSNSGNLDIDVVHTHASFASHKLLNPRIWDRQKIKTSYAKLKMPNFYLAEEEVEALVTYLLSRRPARVADSLKVHYDNGLAGPMAEGRHLVRELNCLGCHKIEDNIAAIHQFITVAAADEEGEWGDEDWEADEEEDEDDQDDEGGDQADEEDDEDDDTDVALGKLGESYGGPFDAVNGPPWLRGQGAKVQPGWLHSFLLNVEPLRPWLKVRMPSFDDLTSEQAAVLVDYFAALSKKESNLLKEKLKRVHKYIADAEDADEARANWHQHEGTAKTAALLGNYTIENELIKAYNFDFTNKDESHVADVYRRVLANAEFFAHLYDIQYPFENDDYTPMAPSAYSLGERLFGELQCLSCHVLGDPNVPGSNPVPTAPNLALAHKRLRYEWFYQWLQEPGKIQPETAMPPWFPGAQSAFSKEMGYSDDLRKPLEAVYTDNGETQMKMLMDFVWQAGITNYTAVDPSRLPPEDEAQPAAGQQPPVPDQKTQPAAQAMPPVEPRAEQQVRDQPAVSGETTVYPPETIVLSAEVADRAGVGPRAAGVVDDLPNGGSIIGRVIWNGGEVPHDHLPVAPDFRPICCPNRSTMPLQRLRVDARTRGIADCVVYLAGDVGKMPPYPATSQQPTITIRNCQFDQRVALLLRGLVVRFVNDDDLPHNIRGRMGRTLLWSRNLIEQGATADFGVDKLGIIQTRSGSGFDWMDSYIWVVDHAGYALTDDEGDFVLENIPPGEYTLHVWHPGIRLLTSEGGDEPVAPAVNFEPPKVVGGRVTVEEAKTTRLVVEMQ